MARPKTKTELLSLSKLNYNKLIDYIESLSASDQEKDFPKGTMNRNIRDVLAHLHDWHVMMQNWHDVGMTGSIPDMPAPGYSWKTTPELNRKIWEKNTVHTLSTAKKMLDKSYSDLRMTIDTQSNDDLFTKKKYKWTGSTSIGSYMVSATSSHYDWAFKLIKKATK